MIQIALLALTPLLGPPQIPQSGVAVPGASDPVARSTDGEFSRGMFAEWLLHTRGEIQAPIFADTWLSAREADRLGLEDVSEEARRQVEEEIQLRIDMAYGGAEDKWFNELKIARRTAEGRRAERFHEIARALDLRNIAAHERVVPREKIIRDWEREYGPDGRRFEVRMLYLRVVMPPMGGLTRQEQIEAREKAIATRIAEADALRERVRAGEQFPALVREFSEDTATRSSGGRPASGVMDTLGWPKDTLDELAGLAPGEICDPVFVKGGVWIIQLDRVVETPLSEVEAEIHARLLAAGPESDEIAMTRSRLLEGITIETLDALHERSGETPLALDTPVLRIDGVDITRGEYAAFLLHAAGDGAAPRFCEEMHIEKLAAEAGIAPTPEEIEARVEKDVADLVDYFHKGDRASWEEETANLRGSVESWWRDARTQRRFELLLARLILVNREVTEDQLRVAWRSLYGEDGHSLRLRMIRIDAVAPELPVDTPPEEAQKRSEAALEAARLLAADVAERARNGEDFATLARQFSSDDGTRESGGELPLGTDHRTFAPQMADAVEALEQGEITGPHEVGISHFLFELVEKRVVAFEEVADELREQLMTAEPTNVETRGFYNVSVRDLEIEVLPALFR